MADNEARTDAHARTEGPLPSEVLGNLNAQLADNEARTDAHARTEGPLPSEVLGNLNAQLADNEARTDAHTQTEGPLPSEVLDIHDAWFGEVASRAASARATVSAGPSLRAAALDIPRMYALWTLDFLVELAYAVSNDYLDRPHLYQSAGLPDELVELRANYGFARDLPNAALRQQMLLPIFGRSDSQRMDGSRRMDGSSSPFHMARRKLIDASIAFSERVFDTGLEMLKARIHSAVVPLSSHLVSLSGRSLQTSNAQISHLFDVAHTILTNRAVAGVFGVVAPQVEWPLDSDDPNGARLVRAISTTLQLPMEVTMTFDEVILLQRVASEGRQALSIILSEGVRRNVLSRGRVSEDLLNQLVSTVYTWGTSLRDFQS